MKANCDISISRCGRELLRQVIPLIAAAPNERLHVFLQKKPIVHKPVAELEISSNIPPAIVTEAHHAE